MPAAGFGEADMSRSGIPSIPFLGKGCTQFCDRILIASFPGQFGQEASNRSVNSNGFGGGDAKTRNRFFACASAIRFGNG